MAYVVSLNLHRRHLDESQRAIAAAKALPMYEEEAKKRKEEAGKLYGESHPKSPEVRGDCPQPLESTVAATDSIESMGRASDKVGKDFNVDGRTVRKGKKVLKTGIPELTEKVEQGELAVNSAEMIATLPAEEQKEVLEGMLKPTRARGEIPRTDIKANLPESEHRQARDDAAKALNVSPRTVEYAGKVREARKREPKPCKVTVIENPHPERVCSEA